MRGNRWSEWFIPFLWIIWHAIVFIRSTSSPIFFVIYAASLSKQNYPTHTGGVLIFIWIWSPRKCEKAAYMQNNLCSLWYCTHIHKGQGIQMWKVLQQSNWHLTFIWKEKKTWRSYNDGDDRFDVFVRYLPAHIDGIAPIKYSEAQGNLAFAKKRQWHNDTRSRIPAHHIKNFDWEEWLFSSVRNRAECLA